MQTGVFRTILCPIDLEKVSMGALVTARTLAEQHQASLHLVHAVTPPLPGPLELLPELEKTLGDRLETLARKHFGDKLPCNISVVRGEPAAVILRAVEDLGADLIVMATHGHTGLNRLLLGSVTERVVRASPVPVLTIRPERRGRR
jgi:nucleotide-binding universal stress UspA family protein